MASRVTRPTPLSSWKDGSSSASQLLGRAPGQLGEVAVEVGLVVVAARGRDLGDRHERRRRLQHPAGPLEADHPGGQLGTEPELVPEAAGQVLAGPADAPGPGRRPGPCRPRRPTSVQAWRSSGATIRSVLARRPSTSSQTAKRRGQPRTPWSRSHSSRPAGSGHVGALQRGVPQRTRRHAEQRRGSPAVSARWRRPPGVRRGRSSPARRPRPLSTQP